MDQEEPMTDISATFLRVGEVVSWPGLGVIAKNNKLRIGPPPHPFEKVMIDLMLFKSLCKVYNSIEQ